MIGARFSRWAKARAVRASLTVAAALSTLAAGAGGCTTEAFCFRDCDGTTSATTSSTTASGTGGDGGGCVINCSTTTSFTSSSGGGTGPCMPTNNGIEVCDGIDNDCNDAIDDVVGLDLTDPKTCGTCSNNCFTIPGSNWKTDAAAVSCNAGVCKGECAADYYDIDKDANGYCEYYCIKIGDNDATCDGIDDDCDGQTDEDVNTCTSATDCGYCGHACVVANGTGACEAAPGATICDATNTQCKVAACTCTGVGNCYYDADGIASNGCELKCDKTNGGVEICDGIDNDCDGVVDNNPTDAQIGMTCFGGTKGVCADPTHSGTYQCVAGVVACTGANVVTPGTFQEVCNGADDDCDGAVDDNPVDTGPTFPCPAGAALPLPCQKGTLQCVNGGPVCVGNIDPQPETCDNIDNNCDGIIDNMLPAAQSGTPCNVPMPPPGTATSPCKAGVTACVAGQVICSGSVVPTPGAVDGCGVDNNCDGSLTNQPNFQTDVRHCGSCANDCLAGSSHANWDCVNGTCVFQSCQQGYYDNGAAPDAVAGDHKCDYACQFVSAQEICNGQDDNCDGQKDENVIPPSPVSVCGVYPAANNPECKPYNAASNPGGVSVACVNGGWQCTFHTLGVCGGNAGMTPTSCSGALEVCEVTGPALDNDCNGLVNENVPNWGQPCASDQGLPAPGHGVCRTMGTYVCSAANAVSCNAVKDNTKAGPELCDGIDNDCDGDIDETFNAPGTNTTFFVKPTVTKIRSSPGLWIYSFEASRPNATVTTSGSGNGFYTSAPVGKTIDKTPACSSPAKVPWFNVQPVEVDQTCAAMGGHTCSPTEWQTACFAKSAPTPSCTYGYAPAGATCTSTFSATKKCNIGPSYDFDNNAANGIQNVVLPTGWDTGTTWLTASPPPIANCWADWSGVNGNTTSTDRVYDITGNLREITKAATNQYTLLGGAFDSNAESGSACNFTFYSVDSDFEFFDTGFRCCFTQDPTIYTCGNTAKDGSETDIDCGGIACPKCAATKTCAVNSDCVSNVCISATKKCQ